MRILVATDLHIGFAEKILGRDEDSIRTFEEVLQIASREKVDFVLLGIFVLFSLSVNLKMFLHKAKSLLYKI